MKKFMLIILAAIICSPVFADDFKLEDNCIKLLPPKIQGGKTLMYALKNRESNRKFSDKMLSKQILSNLLWAAWGTNRKDGKRTAPSACNLQETQVYVALPQGLFIYNAEKSCLEQVLDKDIRAEVGVQQFTKDAPVSLIYVTDVSKTKRWDAKTMEFYSVVDVGFISQNVYLYCASEGLSTVVLGWVDKEKLHKAMKLKKDQIIRLTQPVGHPAK